MTSSDSEFDISEANDDLNSLATEFLLLQNAWN